MSLYAIEGIKIPDLPALGPTAPDQQIVVGDGDGNMHSVNAQEYFSELTDSAEVATIEELLAFAGRAGKVYVRYEECTFLRENVLSEEQLDDGEEVVTDGGITFPTADSLGLWRRVFDRTQGVRADWFGPRNHENFKKAMDAAGEWGIVHLTQYAEYVFDDQVIINKGLTIEGNKARIKRAAEVVKTLTAPLSTVNGTVVPIGAVPASWKIGHSIYLTTGNGIHYGSGVRVITSIGATTVTIDAPFGGNNVGSNPDLALSDPDGIAVAAGGSWPATTTRVSRTYPLMNFPGYYNYSADNQAAFTVRNIEFDGNRANMTNSYHWAMNPMLIANNVDFEGCEFHDANNENIMGHGLNFERCFFHDLNGSAVHTSAYWLDETETRHRYSTANKCEIRNVCLIPYIKNGHNAGAWEHSASPGHYTLSGNKFINCGGSLIGQLYTTSENGVDAARQIILIGNHVDGCNGILAGISDIGAGRTTKAGLIVIEGNTLKNCGTNDWRSYDALIQAGYDEIVVANNACAGNTVLLMPESIKSSPVLGGQAYGVPMRIGTKDDQPVSIIMNNEEWLRIDAATGRLLIGVPGDGVNDRILGDAKYDRYGAQYSKLIRNIEKLFNNGSPIFITGKEGENAPSRVHVHPSGTSTIAEITVSDNSNKDLGTQALFTPTGINLIGDLAPFIFARNNGAVEMARFTVDDEFKVSTSMLLNSLKMYAGAGDPAGTPTVPTLYAKINGAPGDILHFHDGAAGSWAAIA